jgi:hypothetical protein
MSTSNDSTASDAGGDSDRSPFDEFFCPPLRIPEASAGDGRPPPDPPDPPESGQSGRVPLEALKGQGATLETPDEDDGSPAHPRPPAADTVPAEYFWNEAHDNARLQRENQTLQEKINRLEKENRELRKATGAPPQPADYEPFPVEALPALPAEYVEAASTALDVEPAFVSVPLLSVLSAGVGASARIKLKRSWQEPATLWTAIVAPSGSSKSPALRHALRPVYRHERDARDAYEVAMDRYDPDGDEPKPVRTRYRTGDPTPEAVVRILQENPRGLLLSRDELAAWIGSFDRYSNGAADLQFWIEIWSGDQLSRDRVGDGNITVSNPAVPLTGTIQPQTLKEKLGDLHFQSGFAARLILCRPPVKPKSWTEADVTRDLLDRYGQLLRTLYALEDRMEDGDPALVPLSEEAKDVWIDFHDRENQRVFRESGVARTCRAKAITHAARIALVLHLCRVADGQQEPGPIDAGTMQSGIEVARWCFTETLRVYHELDLRTEAMDPPDQLLSRMDAEFSTSDAKAHAEDFGVSERTIDNWLGTLQAAGKVEKIHRGYYRKTR